MASRMTTSRRTPAALVVVVSLVLSVLAGATGATGARAASRSATIDWERQGSRVALRNGWTLTATGGPMLEVQDGRGTVLGVIELLNYPLGDDFAAATSKRALVKVMAARIADFHTSIAEDRRATLGEGYRYQPGPTRRTRFHDELAMRYTATTTGPDGAVVERLVGYMAMHAGQVWVLAANGYDPAVFPSDLIELRPEHVAAIVRDLDRLVRKSPLPPAGSALVDGMVAGVDGGLDGGLLYLVWEGRKQRIAQPRAMTEEDVEELGLVRGRRIARVAVGSRRTGSFFAVVPPDGKDARLHVAIGRRLHEIVVQHVRSDVVEPLPRMSANVLDRLVVPRA